MWENYTLPFPKFGVIFNSTSNVSIFAMYPTTFKFLQFDQSVSQSRFDWRNSDHMTCMWSLLYLSSPKCPPTHTELFLSFFLSEYRHGHAWACASTIPCPIGLIAQAIQFELEVMRFLCAYTQSQLYWLTGHSSSEGKSSKQEGLSMRCIPCCWRKYSSCRFGRMIYKKATKLSNIFPWRGQYKKLTPLIYAQRSISQMKTTSLYLGIWVSAKWHQNCFPRFLLYLGIKALDKKPWFTARFQRGEMRGKQKKWRWVLNIIGRSFFLHI